MLLILDNIICLKSVYFEHSSCRHLATQGALRCPAGRHQLGVKLVCLYGTYSWANGSCWC